MRRFAARTDGSPDQFEAFFVAVRNALQPRLYTIDILRGLASRGTPLFGLSNMSQPIYEWLCERHEFFNLFDAVVLSGVVRLVKPEPGIYQYLANTYGLVPHQSLFIGDVRANIDAALNCGFQAIHFTDAPALRRQLQAHGIKID